MISISKTKLHPILLGGDQLTASRARGAKKAKVNSFESESRLDGLIPMAEDWHTRLNFIEVSVISPIHTHMHTHTYTHTHMHAHTHARMHAHTHPKSHYCRYRKCNNGAYSIAHY